MMLSLGVLVHGAAITYKFAVCVSPSSMRTEEQISPKKYNVIKRHIGPDASFPPYFSEL